MNHKLLDYEKVLKFIRSCVTSRQNNVAYRMAFNFHTKHKDHSFLDSLLDECDRNMIEIVGRP